MFSIERGRFAYYHITDQEKGRDRDREVYNAIKHDQPRPHRARKWSGASPDA